MSGVFEYRPLSKSGDEIRLLDLYPLQRPGPVRCSIRHAHLQERPHYETVSYCWGDSDLSASIEVDGRHLPVPMNTEKALIRMALPDRPRTLWIDAVCIVQDDSEEKSHQVSLMGQIYSTSAGNLVYFGESNEYTTRAITNIRAFAREIREIATADSDGERLFVNQGWFHCQGPMRSNIDVEALSSFFGNEWFLRSWPVQEVVLAPASTLYCGDHVIDFYLAIDVAAWFRHYYRFHVPLRLIGAPGVVNASSIRWYRQAIASRSRIVKLGSTIATSHVLNASDSRDKVFSMLGLTHPETQIPRLLQPDYGKDVSAVLRDACLYILTVEKNAYPLRLLHHRQVEDLETSEFPSWVPRLDRRFDRYQDARTLMFPPRPSQAFSGEGCYDPDAPHALKLKGRAMGVISSLSSTLYMDSGNDVQHLLELDILAAAMCENLSCPLEVLARTLVACSPYYVARIGEAFFAAGYQAALAEARNGSLISIRTQRLAADASQTSNSMASIYLEAVFTACRHRRIMVTADGRLGLAPKLCEAGDLVIQLSAAPMVVVLRRSRRDFLMLGECYFDNALGVDGTRPSTNIDVIEESFTIL